MFSANYASTGKDAATNAARKTNMSGMSFFVCLCLMENTRNMITVPRKNPHNVYLIQNAQAALTAIKAVSFLQGKDLVLTVFRMMYNEIT